VPSLTVLELISLIVLVIVSALLTGANSSYEHLRA